ncbi:MAG: hypothetical protein JSS51_03520 [Planctomycetes bacterium]|nr:hypothetical protein [Planctomycetota bacterium]
MMTTFHPKRVSLSRIGPVEWGGAGGLRTTEGDAMKTRRWPFVAMFGTLSLSYFTMIATAAGMVSDADSHIRAENTSVGMGAFIGSLILAITTTTAAVTWAVTMRSDIKALKRQVREQGREIDILRGVCGQDASDTDL